MQPFDLLKYDPGYMKDEEEEGGWGVSTKWLLRDIMFSCALYNSGWC